MRRIGVVLVAVLALFAPGLPGAQARTAPYITMYPVQAKITAGDEPHFGYTTYGLPTGAVVQLQRLTVNGWTTLKEIPRGAHKYTAAPALTSLGRYQYRIQSVQSGSVVARSAVHYVYAYGTVLMKALCDPLGGFCRNQHQPVTIGGEDFHYAMDIGAGVYPNYSTSNSAHLPATSCRSITMQYASDDYSAEDATYLRVTQPGAARQESHAPIDTVGHLTATLTGGQFFVVASLDPHVARGMLIGGYASCYSKNGVPPT